MAETAVEEIDAKADLLDELTEVESIAVRFAGDSGDGSQFVGGEFANTSAIVGNDISTMPDFPRRNPCARGHIAGNQRVPGTHFE